MRRVPTCLPVALAILIAAPLGACHRTPSAPPTDGGATVEPAGTTPANAPADSATQFGTSAAAMAPKLPVKAPNFTVEKPDGVPMSAASKVAAVPHEATGKEAAMTKVPN